MWLISRCISEKGLEWTRLTTEGKGPCRVMDIGEAVSGLVDGGVMSVSSSTSKLRGKQHVCQFKFLSER